MTKWLTILILVFTIIGCGKPEEHKIDVAPRDMTCPAGYTAMLTGGWGDCFCFETGNPHAQPAVECGTDTLPVQPQCPTGYTKITGAWGSCSCIDPANPSQPAISCH